jgi:hypothetical protein
LFPDIFSGVTLAAEWSGGMKSKKIRPDNDMDKPNDVRTVSADPGLLSNEELLKKLPGNRRFTLEQIIANEKVLKDRSSLASTLHRIFKKARKRVRWFVDHAQLKISVSHNIMEHMIDEANH